MNRDRKGRFAKRISDADLIRKMDFNFNRDLKPRETPIKKNLNVREVPVEDKRKTITVPLVNFESNNNGRIYNFDKDLIEKALKNINRLGLGSLDHPVERSSFFDMFTCECAKEKAKKTDGELISTLSKNMSDTLPKAKLVQKEETKPRVKTLMANMRTISWYGNKLGGCGITIQSNLKDFVASFNETIMVSMNIPASDFPNIISFLGELKLYDYFTVVFNSYNAQGYQVEHKTFDGFKLFDLTYIGEKDIYNITLAKDNI